MERIKTLIIGAGAVGLAIARELSEIQSDVVAVDKENSFGKHTSSRNSEVIHAGLYYPAGSLKARLCVAGNKLLYEYLESSDLPYKNCGKIVVATKPEESSILQDYHHLGIENGCKGLRLLSQDDVVEMEPRVNCYSGLFVPSTGIFDTHKYMQCLAKEAEDRGAFIVYGMEVQAIHRDHSQYLVEFTNGESFLCDNVINSAGLWADQIAELVGINVDSLKIRQHLCKGEYYKSTRISGINHLIYPVADPQGVFLGIHLTINMNGEVRFGPNAFYVDEIGYRFVDEYVKDFHTAINRYIDVAIDELVPDDTGIRAKLQGPGENFRDFYIKEEGSNGLPGFVNLIGIESPGLTASLAIARYVADLITKKSPENRSLPKI